MAQEYYLMVTDKGRTVAERWAPVLTPTLVGSLPNGTVTLLKVVSSAKKGEPPPKENPRITDQEWALAHWTNLTQTLCPDDSTLAYARTMPPPAKEAAINATARPLKKTEPKETKRSTRSKR